MPGFMAADTMLGLAGLASSNDAIVEKQRPIHAALRADDAFDIRASTIDTARRHGVTSGVSAPLGGLIRGRGGFFDLLDRADHESEDAWVGHSGMYISMGEHGAKAIENSRIAAFGALREFMDAVRLYKRSPRVFDSMSQPFASCLDLKAMVPVLDKKLPLIVEVYRASDILAVLRFFKKQLIRGVILGATEGWLVAQELARAKVYVVVDPEENLPSRFESRAARGDNAALLAEAGVKVVVASRMSHTPQSTRFALGNAVRFGMSWLDALKSGTLSAAEAFDQGKWVGSLEAGKQANIVEWRSI